MSDQLNLVGKVALVTGASRGIGKAIALRLAREGVRVIVSATSLDRLEQTVAEIQDMKGEAVGIPCDLSQPDQVKKLAEQAFETFNQLDILVNNAGTSIKKPFYESTDDEWQTLFAVNAMAPFILCRECLPALQGSKAATIVQIGSVVGLKGYVSQSLYTASKHALIGFTKVLAQEVQPFGIRVHAINPGGVYTDMVKTMRPDLDPSGLIQPEDIAEFVYFLISHRGNAMVDDLHIRRVNGDPWY